MPLTSGLLISLTCDDAATQLRQALTEKACVMLGNQEGLWLPVAIEAEDDAGLRELHDWIAGLPGVAFVDVVQVHFDDPTTTTSLST